jgi:hypothetical protein
VARRAPTDGRRTAPRRRPARLTLRIDTTPEWRHVCRNDTAIEPDVSGVAHGGCVVAGAFDT